MSRPYERADRRLCPNTKTVIILQLPAPRERPLSVNLIEFVGLALDHLMDWGVMKPTLLYKPLFTDVAPKKSVQALTRAAPSVCSTFWKKLSSMGWSKTYS